MCLLRFCTVLLFVCGFSTTLVAGDLYEKKLIKNRAERYKDNNGVSPSGVQYIYVDDAKAKQSIKDQQKNNRRVSRRDRNSLFIASPTVRRRGKVKSVKIAVDLKDELRIDAKRTRGSKKSTVDIGHITIEKGSKVEKVNAIIDAKKGISVK